MAGKRDYRAEYGRRIANAAKRGLSRSQARGHARLGETGLRPPRLKDIERLELAYKEMRRTGSQTLAARIYYIAPERLRRFVRENTLAERRGRIWHFTDERLRRMTVLTGGEAISLILAGFDQASLNGRHLAAVQEFLRSNEIEVLKPFDGLSVIDAKGKAYLLETDPNNLHRLAAAGSEVFHEIYRLII